jgi:8-oxo-dGTP pyrophosphatase MutT (NUDIX family)
MATPRVAAGVLFFDQADRVLLVDPSYKPGWEIPGGYVQPGETPSEAAAREVAEELGIKPPIGRLLVADWAPNAKEGDKLLFVFDGGLLARDHQDAIVLQPTEITSYDFHDPTRLAELMIPRLARRITAAFDARHDLTTAYLEHGRPIQP